MSIRVRFGSKADICSATSDERQVPIADVAASWPLSLRRHRRIEGPPRFLQHRMRLLYRRTPTRLTPPFALPPAL